MSGLPTCKAVLANWASNCCQSVIRPSQQEIQEYLLMVVCLSDRELRQAQVLQISDNHEGRTGLLLPTSWRSNLPAHVLLHLHLIFGMALLNFRNLAVGQWPQLHKSFPMSWGNYETITNNHHLHHIYIHWNSIVIMRSGELVIPPTISQCTRLIHLKNFRPVLLEGLLT